MRQKSNILKAVLLLVIIVTSVYFSHSFAFTQMLNPPSVHAGNRHQQVTICHATGSNSNPYSRITVDDDSVDGDGNSDHNRSGHQNGEDIIPPGSWDHDGRNWTTQGQAIYNNNCNIPSPSPSPRPSQVCSPTPSPTPSIIPSPTPSLSPTPSPTPSIIPSPTPSLEPSPSPSLSPAPSEDPGESPEPSPSSSPEASQEPEVSPSPSPSAAASSTPTPSSSSSSNSNNSSSSSSSDSSSSSSSGPQGEVLGAYAGTGIVEDSLFALASPIGGLMFGTGTILYGKKNKKK